jgi:hypothetical protein
MLYLQHETTEEIASLNTRHIIPPVLLGALGLPPAAAQDSVTTDAGTIFADKTKRFF